MPTNDHAVPAAQSPSAERQKQADAKIERRRELALEKLDDGSVIKINGLWRSLSNPAVQAVFKTRKERTGMALSGGGIRSATLSLGLIEAFASRGRFYGLDFLSTVSGGGYCGSFLRALYVERGTDVGKVEKTDAVLRDRTAFADATLASLPDQQYFRGEPGPSVFVQPNKVIKNPLWWLRENGRYLAPSGMSDYSYALSYVVRNWVTLLTFVLGCLMVVFAALQLFLVAAINGAEHVRSGWPFRILHELRDWHLYTPLVPLLVMMSLIRTGFAAAYWLALPLPFARPVGDRVKSKGRGTVIALVGLFVLLLAAIVVGYVGDLLPRNPTATAWTIGLATVVLAGLGSAGVTTWHGGRTAVDFRREQTRLLTGFTILFVLLCSVAAIDGFALFFRAQLTSSPALVRATAGSSALASIASFLIAKVPTWFGGEGSRVRRLLASYADQAALLAAIVILAAIALVADLLVLKLLWHGNAWTDGMTDMWVLIPVIGTIMLVIGLFGRSENFANLLALTPLYSSRVTRAYLGGSNAHRLDAGNPSDVTHGMVGDDIALQAYMGEDTPAPLHLINVTRNRTVGDRITRSAIDVDHDDPLVRESESDPRGRLASYESSLTLHDRHGDRMVFGPFGVRVGADFFDWHDIEGAPSLGLLCAISGAAVGSGMGRRTSLGTAMALTLANVRLGYWWPEQHRKPTAERPPANEIAGEVPGATTSGSTAQIAAFIEKIERRWRRLASLSLAYAKDFPGFICLYRELLGQFGTKGHWLLSDGGHSENSGALSLLERGCQLIIVADNAQDPSFTFGDLEIFIRTARTDIGLEVTVVEHDQFPKSLKKAKSCFFNGTAGDWRKRVKGQDDQAFALLLKASDIPFREDGKWKQRYEGSSLIIWLKPNRFADLPADIAAYAEMQPDFPQQSTGNQFFDEAQWESYRRLGFEMGRRLLESHDTLADFLPVIYRKTERPRPSSSAEHKACPDAAAQFLAKRMTAIRKVFSGK